MDKFIDQVKTLTKNNQPNISKYTKAQVNTINRIWKRWKKDILKMAKQGNHYLYIPSICTPKAYRTCQNITINTDKIYYANTAFRKDITRKVEEEGFSITMCYHDFTEHWYVIISW